MMLDKDSGLHLAGQSVSSLKPMPLPVSVLYAVLVGVNHFVHVYTGFGDTLCSAHLLFL